MFFLNESSQPLLNWSPTRRGFLQTAAAAISSCFLPWQTRINERWFLHTGTGESWPVDDPVAWSMENAQQPVLERARQRLLTLNSISDPQRVIRLVTRRCRLNLIEVLAHQVTVHYWGQQGWADLRPFFKQHGLTRNDIEVVLIDRKREITTIQQGDDFLYGERLARNFLWKLYLTKWQHRAVKETDDWTAAPGTRSGFRSEGLEPNLIPWAALKSAWRQTTSPLCQNCDTPTILTNFGLVQCGMFNRSPRFIHACGHCRRFFEDRSIKDVGKWLVDNLDSEVLPGFSIFWGKPVKWKPSERDV